MFQQTTPHESGLGRYAALRNAIYFSLRESHELLVCSRHPATWKSRGAIVLNTLRGRLYVAGRELAQHRREDLRGHYPEPPAKVGRIHRLSYTEMGVALAQEVYRTAIHSLCLPQKPISEPVNIPKDRLVEFYPITAELLRDLPAFDAEYYANRVTDELQRASAPAPPGLRAEPMTALLTKDNIAQIFGVGKNSVNEILAAYEHQKIGSRYRLRMSDMPPDYQKKHG